jgi:hypothetical protein
MSKLAKAKERLLSIPRDYTYDEARYLLGQLGFLEDNKGKTSGSRVEFFREDDNASILLHKPHPGNDMNLARVKGLIRALKRMGDL